MSSSINKLALEFRQYFLDHPEIWFDPAKKYDAEIIAEFGDLMKTNTDNLTDLLKLKGITRELNIAIILVFDQLPYYIHRNEMGKVRELQKRISGFAEYLFFHELTEYSPTEQCFIMLNMRHTGRNNADTLKVLIERIQELRSVEYCSIYRRFYKATLIQLGKVNNEKLEINGDIKFSKVDTNLLDPQSTFTGIEDIKLVCDNPLVAKTIKELKKFYTSRSKTSICVSFSGGVDSMVLLYLLSQLSSVHVIALHINYGNRETAYAESQFCQAMAKHFGVSITVRNITEIKRQRDVDREIYEDVTRRIRFGAYEKIQNDRVSYTISLGHNYDDCLENIVSNITKQQKVENLCGMTAVGKENGVEITRPFLELSKADIYEIANVCGLPYLYDSTPKWSERGRKRDILFPQLNDFDSRILSGLYAMSKQVSDMAEVFNAAINENYEKYSDCYAINEIYSEYHLRATLNAICQEEGMEYFSGKAIANLWNEIDNEKHYCGKKINLNKKWYYKYDEDDDGVFPHHIYRV
jgi:tRNA(Ile)-lysidine synthetase-like protein